MPSKKRRQPAQKKKKQVSPRGYQASHLGFFPFLTLVFVAWVLYRSFFSFPTWFDETLGKAVFFGFPVWLYVMMSRSKSIPDTFAVYKLKTGLFLGIAVGGVFGFAASIFSLLMRGGVVEGAWLFTSEVFWREFILAMMTGFWETLLFFSLVQVVIQEKFVRWSVLHQVVLVALIFTVFHLPNIILRYEPYQVAGQIMLMILFALGQGFLFASRKNAYALVLSHAIWGMVLLVQFW